MIYIKIFKSKKNKKDSIENIHPIEKVNSYVETLDKKNFDVFISKYPLSVVDFWAPWCAPCKELVPRFRRLLKIYDGKVAFGKLDIQNNPDIAQKYRILGIPHVIFFSFGKKITSLSGLKSINKMKEKIDNCYKKIGLA